MKVAFNNNWFIKLSQSNKGVITYNFDCTLTIPKWSEEDGFYEETMNPNWKTINLLKRYHDKGYSIHIVTSRDQRREPSVDSVYGNNEMGVYDFLKAYDLLKYIDDVHFTGQNYQGDKTETLKNLKSLRHYDDSDYDLQSAEEAGAKPRKIKHPSD